MNQVWGVLRLLRKIKNEEKNLPVPISETFELFNEDTAEGWPYPSAGYNVLNISILFNK